MAPLYSRHPARLARQAISDVLIVLWCWWWWRTGAGVDAALSSAAVSGDRAVAEVHGFSDRIEAAAGRLQNLPLVGQDLSEPVADLADALDSVAGSASAQLSALAQSTGWIALAVTLVPVSVGLLAWWPARFRFARESLRSLALRRAGGAADRPDHAPPASRRGDGGAAEPPADASGAESLLALRALVSLPPARLAGLGGDPVAAWRSDERAMVRRLANLQLRELGLRGLD